MTDREIGIETFVSNADDRIDGEIKRLPADFRVRELSRVKYGDEGKYLIIEVTKENWDTHHLIREISRSLHISQKRIDCAGTKDKRALTTQKLSIFGVDEAGLDRIRLPRVETKPLGYADKPISLGDLYGNEFEIVIRNIDVSHVEDRISRICDELKHKGVPNFFGSQRFGTRRPVTHLVGEKLIKEDFEGAAMVYIAKPFPAESEEARVARSYIWETKDLKQGLRKMPGFLRYERAMLHELIRSGDYTRCFKALPFNLLMLFVHAYQSYLFNLILSRRLKMGLPINMAMDGDTVCFANNGFPDVSTIQTVNHRNIGEMNELIKKGKAFVTAPLIGYETVFASGIQGEIEREIIEESGVEPKDFKIGKLRRLSSKGSVRPMTIPFNPYYEVSEDDVNDGKTNVELKFRLPKGSYATSVLREFMG